LLDFENFYFRLTESAVPSPPTSHLRSDRLSRRSFDADIEPSSDDLGMKKRNQMKN